MRISTTRIQNSGHCLPGVPSVRHAARALAVLSAVASLALAVSAADTTEIADDFGGALAPAWQKYAPLAAFGVPVTVATQDGVLLFAHPPSPVPTVAPAIVGAFRPDVTWSDFEVAVDFSGWSTGSKVNTTIALGGRTSTGSDGLANQYLLTIQPSATPELAGTGFQADPGMSLEHVANGALVPGGSLVLTSFPPLDPAKWYRAVFRGRSLQSVPQLRLEGELYQVGVPGLIAHLAARLPAAYYSGAVSLGAVDRAALAGIANNGVTVKFDNFTAKGAHVPPFTEPSVSVRRAVVLSWRWRRRVGFWKERRRPTAPGRRSSVPPKSWAPRIN